jgi:spoIIIJ-associated protein
VNSTTDAVEAIPVDEAEAPDATDAEANPKRGSARTRLEEEGDIAADYLEELLDITDLDGDIDIDIENGRASVAIVADEAGTPALEKLVGSSGEVLEALQELTRLAVQAQTGDRTRLMLDVAGHRLTKRGALARLAAEVVARVRASGAAERLDPMPAFERKVVHDAVATAGLVSESEGEEPRRRVVVLPTPTEDGPQGDDA